MTAIAPAWIAEAVRYVGFSAADEARLRAFHAVAHTYYVGIVDHFYAVIDRHEDARRVITDGKAQVERLKGTLIAWMSTGLDGAHDDVWYAARARIGQRHVAIGLPSRYMFTAINLIRADLGRLVATLIAPGDRAATTEAVDRWLDLELAIMLQSYQEASEDRIMQRERDAQQENLAAMRRLSAGLAHEVRNPLNAAHLQLELLARRLRRGGAEPGLLDVTALIDSEIRRLSGLLQEFLDFARPVQLTAVDTDLVEIARQVIEVSAARSAGRRVAIAITGDAEVHIVCDPGKLHQILHNLIANAIDAAASQVVVELRGGGDVSATIRVHDDGDGVPDEVRSRVFEPFFSTKDQGTGMGLSITYSLVVLHGGTIDVANRGGAEFLVTLPPHPSPIH